MRLSIESAHNRAIQTLVLALIDRATCSATELKAENRRNAIRVLILRICDGAKERLAVQEAEKQRLGESSIAETFEKVENVEDQYIFNEQTAQMLAETISNVDVGDVSISEKDVMRALYEKELSLRIAADAARDEAEKEVILLREELLALSASSKKREELVAALTAGAELQVSEPPSRTKENLRTHLSSASDLHNAFAATSTDGNEPLGELPEAATSDPTYDALHEFLSTLARNRQNYPQDIQNIDLLSIVSSLMTEHSEEVKRFLDAVMEESKAHAELLALSTEDAMRMIDDLTRK